MEQVLELLKSNKIDEAKEVLLSVLNSMGDIKLADILLSIIEMDKQRNNNFKYTKQILADLSDQNIKLRATEYYRYYLENIRAKRFDIARLWMIPMQKFAIHGYIDVSLEELKISRIIEQKKEYNKILELLKSKHTEAAQEEITNYLFRNNKSHIEALAIKIFDLDIAKSNAYKYTKELLADLSVQNIKTQVEEYYRQYKTNIITESFHIAKTWVDVIEEAKRLKYLDLPFENNMMAKINTIEMLLLGNTEEALKQLHVFLEANNLLDFEKILISVINMDNSRDNKFKYTKQILSNLSEENIKQMADEFYRLYQENLRTKNFKIAELWLTPICILSEEGFIKVGKETIISEFNSSLLKDPNNSDVEEYVDYIRLINYFNQTDKDIPFICQKYNLNYEENLIFRILLAQEFYKNEFYEAGDSLIAEVQKSKNKTISVNVLLSQTQKRKQWLKNDADKIIMKRLLDI